MEQTPDRSRLIAAARAEAVRMRAATAGRDEAAGVRLSNAQFATLATLIERLADAAALPRPAAPGGCRPDCMGAPIDGIRFWAPMPQVEGLTAAYRQLAAKLADRESFGV